MAAVTKRPFAAASLMNTKMLPSKLDCNVHQHKLCPQTAALPSLRRRRGYAPSTPTHKCTAMRSVQQRAVIWGHGVMSHAPARRCTVLRAAAAEVAQPVQEGFYVTKAIPQPYRGPVKMDKIPGALLGGCSALLPLCCFRGAGGGSSAATRCGCSSAACCWSIQLSLRSTALHSACCPGMRSCF